MARKIFKKKIAEKKEKWVVELEKSINAGWARLLDGGRKKIVDNNCPPIG